MSGQKIIEGLTQAVAVANGEDQPARVTILDAAREEGPGGGGGEPVASVDLADRGGVRWASRTTAESLGQGSPLYASPSPPLPVGVGELAKVVHRARFRGEREPTPWETENQDGQDYSRRIAVAILSALSGPSGGEDHGSSRDLSPSVSAKLEGWQPIESAPKDGTEVLVTMTHSLGDGEWQNLQWVDWQNEAVRWPIYRERIDIPFPPTHWKLLDPPPSPPSGGDHMKEEK